MKKMTYIYEEDNIVIVKYKKKMNYYLIIETIA